MPRVRRLEGAGGRAGGARARWRWRRVEGEGEGRRPARRRASPAALALAEAAPHTPLLAATVAAVSAQALKPALVKLAGGAVDEAFSWRTSGGFPSSHTASMIALVVSVGRQEGPGSPTFALAFVLAMIVMYDAANVRLSAGEQAAVLNRLVDALEERGVLREAEGGGEGADDSDSRPGGWKVPVRAGHTPNEVFGGAAWGALIGLWL